MSENKYRQRISFFDIFSWTWLRVLFRAIWLFFPSILFLVLAWFAFWQITQGKDLLQRTLESKRIFGTFIVAEIFWVYITWYTSRIVGKVKFAGLSDTPDKEEQFWGRFLIQMPRFLGFSCLTIIILAFLKLKFDPSGKLNFLFYLALGLSLPFYSLIYNFWSRLADKAETFTDIKNQKKYLSSFRYTTYILLGVSVIVISFSKSYYFLIVLLFAIQIGLVLLLVFRRKLIFIDNPHTNKVNHDNKTLLVRAKKFVFDNEDKFYTRVFFFILIVGLALYISTIFSTEFSAYIGAVPFILLAFGILLILGNGVSFLSVLKRINLHIVVFFFAFLVGLFFEPHYAEIPNKKNTTNLFHNRLDLDDYFKNWIEQRKAELEDSSNTKPFPVYFVLADGGASRSGYWAASVLAKINAETSNKFSKHLFCLSGASGGSVGNVAYFNLLRAQQTDDTLYKDGLRSVQDYLETDFLTFTIARMLGPDVLRHILPFPFIADRAAALAKILERGSGKNALLYNSMATSFSEVITQKNKPYDLPILCINTTRMQDGRPAVISNIDLTDPNYNKRLDFLDLLDEESDIKLSTSVVLGASFPYLSPAGRVDAANGKHYFVDGGYFDNSGSGVVSEMINILIKDTLYQKYKKRLRFYVLHITNSPQGATALEKVNPLVNDLAAPVKTLIGAYGTQTIINDERLKNFMITTYGDAVHYRIFNLYDDNKKITYSMNWVISDQLLDAMNESLNYNKELKKLVAELNN